jgi:hemin uptake protein HemP
MNTPMPAPPVERELPVLPSATLLRGQKAVAIDHNGLLYRLQTTRQGKLILTK